MVDTKSPVRSNPGGLFLWARCLGFGLLTTSRKCSTSLREASLTVTCFAYFRGGLAAFFFLSHQRPARLARLQIGFRLLSL
jgi:hypothetical protein